MAASVLMPKAGISVESCVIGTWKKQVGEAVAVGDVLFDYETDKASFECESTVSGILLEILYENGEEVEVLQPVCFIGVQGESTAGLKEQAAGAGARAGQPPTAIAAPREAPAAQGKAADALRAAVSPRARSLAERLGVDAQGAEGTGPQGRVIARDIRALQERGGQALAPAGETALMPAAQLALTPALQLAGAEYTEERMSKVRRTIAKSMLHSLQTGAQLTHHHAFDATGILALRAQCKAEGEAMGLTGVSLGDMVLYAVARTLKAHPALNAHLLEGDMLRTFNHVHLGVAVDTPRGLLVPTVFHADTMSLLELSREVKRLAGLARTGSIAPDLLQGASFTVSNLGATGVELFTPILNPPQVGIVGVCGVTTRVREGADGLAAYPCMGMSLTYDHRAVDGAPASRFMKELMHNLEQFNLFLIQ